MQCRRCGYCEFVDREIDEEGKRTYQYEINEGAGVLFYRAKNAVACVLHYLPTQEEVTRAGDGLRKELVTGGVDSESAYLTRWDPEKKVVEFVIGAFYDPA